MAPEIAVYRSWPAASEKARTDGRAGVHDALPRLVISNYDLASEPAVWTLGSFILLEWDIYLPPRALATFRGHIAKDPGHVHVAPYLVYPPTTGRSTEYACWRGEEGGELTAVDRDTPWCDWFGFGCTYLPSWALTAYHKAPRHPHTVWLSDLAFCAWYRKQPGCAQTPIHWDVEVIHLHR